MDIMMTIATLFYNFGFVSQLRKALMFKTWRAKRIIDDFRSCLHLCVRERERERESLFLFFV